MVITLDVVNFEFESSCLYCFQLTLLNCFLGRLGICIECAVIFAMVGTWSKEVSGPRMRCLLYLCFCFQCLKMLGEER